MRQCSCAASPTSTCDPRVGVIVNTSSIHGAVSVEFSGTGVRHAGSGARVRGRRRAGQLRGAGRGPSRTDGGVAGYPGGEGAGARVVDAAPSGRKDGHDGGGGGSGAVNGL